MSNCQASSVFFSILYLSLVFKFSFAVCVLVALSLSQLYPIRYFENAQIKRSTPGPIDVGRNLNFVFVARAIKISNDVERHRNGFNGFSSKNKIKIWIRVKWKSLLFVFLTRSSIDRFFVIFFSFTKWCQRRESIGFFTAETSAYLVYEARAINEINAADGFFETASSSSCDRKRVKIFSQRLVVMRVQSTHVSPVLPTAFNF